MTVLFRGEVVEEQMGNRSEEDNMRLSWVDSLLLCCKNVNTSLGCKEEGEESSLGSRALNTNKLAGQGCSLEVCPFLHGLACEYQGF